MATSYLLDQNFQIIGIGCYFAVPADFHICARRTKTIAYDATEKAISLSITSNSIALIIAAICAAIMGYAIQRGSTCIVAAVDELITKRRANRFMSLAEAAAWVTAGALLWQMLGRHVALPIGYPASLSTAAGGLLLGIGALVTRACAFGAIARIGSGEWIYLLTPIGFFIGCVTLWPLIGHFPPMHVASPVFNAGWLLVPFAFFVSWRLIEALRAGRSGMFAAHVWHPHRATTVIGIAFAISLIAIGPWAYTSALAAIAQGQKANMFDKLLLLAIMLAGALAGGRTSGRLRWHRPTLEVAIRCVAGGALMGWGTLLIPGGNDELLLVGIPLLQPYAWLAVTSMALAIGVGQIAERRLIARSASPRIDDQ